MTDLNRAYTKYVRIREEARHRIQQEVANASHEELVSLGAAIAEAQRDGMSMTEIARTLGIQYRNVLYDAKRAYAESKGEDPDVRPYTVGTVRRPKVDADVPVQAVVPQDATVEETFTIERLEDGWEVEAFGSTWSLYCDEDSGRLVIPDEWATASQHERVVYKTIIARIEESK